ncbi:general transcription factor 3C polypeptide 5 [Uranotaenia lowii]|uniref:general transcription factor 3C polypeptide 5 n=1 Tax=Uranotaenia lowii TaxID=190385 RepID=UPI002479E77E|nr:general transcription factor 3C polypeptide 5 [Uranotaenia lowii]
MELDELNAHHHALHNELVCIEYPGRVRNPDRMIASFGGQVQLSTAICSDKRRLELRFRPDSVYSKPAFGDRNETTGILLKLKIRRKRSDLSEVEVRSIKIAGHVSTQYKFESMCDFQLLPAFRNSAGTVECLYDEIVPSGVSSSNPVDKPGKVPFFLPPISFSRFDTTQLTIFKTKENVADLMGRSERGRARRTKHGIYKHFNLTDELPTEPHPLSMENKTAFWKMHGGPEGESNTLRTVRQSFQDRPIWTKTALKCILQLNEEDIKFILPIVAFYFLTGPWRGTWCRFGYDPRKHFESRYYQLLDFRVRSIGALHDKVKIKRSQKPTKPCMRSSNPPVNLNRGKDNQSQSRQLSSKTDCIFTVDTQPQMRIIFYQYCDVQVPEIQQMLQDMTEPVACDEKTGWLPLRFDEQCRNILMGIVVANFRKQGAPSANTSASEFEETEGDETEMTFDEDEDMDDFDDSGDEKFNTFGESSKMEMAE